MTFFCNSKLTYTKFMPTPSIVVILWLETKTDIYIHTNTRTHSPTDTAHANDNQRCVWTANRQKKCNMRLYWHWMQYFICTVSNRIVHFYFGLPLRMNGGWHWITPKLFASVDKIIFFWFCHFFCPHILYTHGISDSCRTYLIICWYVFFRCCFLHRSADSLPYSKYIWSRFEVFNNW